MAEVFISYSRRDKDFVRRLSDALAAHDRPAWVDWKDIPLTAEWQQEIFTNIEAADTFIFVISPDSAASFNCRKEIDHAAVNNKRMVPILYRNLPDNDVPETLARFQRIDLSENENFDSGFAALVKALDTDLGWVQTHTRLLTRAKEWERQGRDNSFLLRGKDLRDAEQWISRSAEHEPKPTPLQSQYLLLSRKAAVRQRRIAYAAAAVALLIAAGLSVYAFITQSRKEDALARSLAGKSAAILSERGDTELAALTALESVKRRSTDEGAQALRNALVYLRRTHAFFGGGKEVADVAFSPDSKRLVAVGPRDDPVARVFDVDTGKELLRLRHDGEVMKAIFSTDGQMVLTGSKDQTARVWDASGGRELQRLACGSEVIALAAGSEGLAATGSRTAAQVWDLRTGRELVRLEYPRPVRALAFSPSGRWFAAGGGDGAVQLWDGAARSTRTLRTLPNPVQTLHFNPADESRLLISATDDDGVGDLEIVDTSSARVLAHSAYRNRFPPWRAFFTSDPNRILVYGTGHASIWDANLKRLMEADVETVLDKTLLTADGRILLTFHSGVLRIADVKATANGKELARIPSPEHINIAELSPDGRLLAVAVEETSRILEIDPPLESLRLTGLGTVSDVSFSPGGRWAAIASKPVHVIDLQRPWDPPRAIPSSDADTLAMDRDGSRLVTGKQTELAVWDARTGAKLAGAPLPGGKVPSPLAFSVDSSRVLFSYGHEKLRAWEWAAGKWSEDPRFEKVHAISGDTRLLAVRPNDQSIRIVEADTQREVTSLPFQFAPFEIGLGGANKLLIGREQHEGLAEIWDLESKKQLARIFDFDRVSSAAISPDGRLVATVGDDDSVRFQLLRRDELIRYACGMISRPLTKDEWKLYLPEDAYAGLRTCPQFQSPNGK